MVDPRNIPDLGTLKGGAERTKQNRKTLRLKNTLECPCGERIVDQGITLFVETEGLFPTDQGPQMGVAMGTMSFHSRTCSEFQKALTSKDPRPIAVRDVPPTEWIEKRSVSVEDNGDRREQHDQRDSTDRNAE